MSVAVASFSQSWSCSCPRVTWSTATLGDTSLERVSGTPAKAPIAMNGLTPGTTSHGTVSSDVDRSEAPALAAEARTAAGTGRDALNAGDVFLSLGSYAEAEEMFALGLEKGGADRDRLLTRLGIAQVHQGKYAEARETFGQVAGERTAVARMWTAYIESRA